MLIPGAGLIPPVMPVPLPTATVPKSTDVYIGKIANTVEDDTIKVWHRSKQKKAMFFRQY